ncbi:MAG: HAD family hydrolase, partial [Anaerolineaceae bacterium]|nr:HAD family hydrolase [Anaerolineaceae bacterium]
FKNQDPRSFARWMIMAAETPGNFLYTLPDHIGFDRHLAKAFNWFARQRHSKREPGDLFYIVNGVKDVLESLNEHYPMAVVSARDARSSQLFLDHFDLAKYFKVVVTAQTCPHTKPYPDPLHYAADELGVPITNCLMIGDTIVDVDAAKAAGAQSLSVLCGFGREKELARAGTHHILPSTAQIKDLLLSEPDEVN